MNICHTSALEQNICSFLFLSNLFAHLVNHPNQIDIGRDEYILSCRIQHFAFSRNPVARILRAADEVCFWHLRVLCKLFECSFSDPARCTYKDGY